MERIEWWTLKCKILTRETEGRRQLVDLYRGLQSDFGNSWRCQPWEERYQYDSLEDGCVWHDSACTPRSIDDSWLDALLVNDLERYWYRTIAPIVSPVPVRGGAACLIWSRRPEAMRWKSFEIDWYAWPNFVMMWLCVGVVRFLSDKMWILNWIKLWKIHENPSRVVARLSARWAFTIMMKFWKKFACIYTLLGTHTAGVSWKL